MFDQNLTKQVALDAEYRKRQEAKAAQHQQLQLLLDTSVSQPQPNLLVRRLRAFWHFIRHGVYTLLARSPRRAKIKRHYESRFEA